MFPEFRNKSWDSRPRYRPEFVDISLSWVTWGFLVQCDRIFPVTLQVSRLCIAELSNFDSITSALAISDVHVLFVKGCIRLMFSRFGSWIFLLNSILPKHLIIFTHYRTCRNFNHLEGILKQLDHGSPLVSCDSAVITMACRSTQKHSRSTLLRLRQMLSTRRVPGDEHGEERNHQPLYQLGRM